MAPITPPSQTTGIPAIIPSHSLSSTSQGTETHKNQLKDSFYVLLCLSI